MCSTCLILLISNPMPKATVAKIILFLVLIYPESVHRQLSFVHVQDTGHDIE